MISLSQLKNNRSKHSRLRADRSNRSNKLLGLPNFKELKINLGIQVMFFGCITLVALFLISSVSKNSNIQTEASTKPGSTRIITNFNNYRSLNQSDNFVVKELVPNIQNSVSNTSNVVDSQNQKK